MRFGTSPGPSGSVGRAGQRDEVDLLDAGVGVAPLAAHELDAVLGLEVDDRVGPAGQQLGRAGQARGGCDRAVAVAIRPPP